MQDQGVTIGGLRGHDPAHVREIKRITWLGLCVNVLLSALKLAGGMLGASQAIVADAVHSLSDSTTDVAVLIGVRYWSKPPDEGHPHGHGRIETLVTAGIGMALAVVAVGLAVGAVSTLRQEHASPPGLIALCAALVSIVSKEILYRWTVRVGRRMRSSAVVANAWHHRSDAFSSVPVLIAVAGARLVPAWAFLDHLGAVVVSVFIFRAGFLIALPAFAELIDAGATRKELGRIRAIALETEGVAQVHGIRTRRVGAALHVDLHILVDGSMSVQRGHQISEAVKERLLENDADLADVVVHLEPYGEER
jgi:cation diffusion facilitator family transporter